VAADYSAVKISLTHAIFGTDLGCSS